MATRTRPVFMLPFTLKGSPYMEMLREHLEAIPDEQSGGMFSVRPFSYAGLFASLADTAKPIVHIHWETNIYGSKYWLASVWRMAVRFPLLFMARAFGARIMWTLHNLGAHDYPHTHLDALGRNLMWHLAQTVIIQNQQIIPSLQRQHPRAHIVYIPHANYVGMYGAKNSSADARTQLNIPSDRIVLLALGGIRPYKRLEKVIAAVQKAYRGGNKNLLLLIAGKGDAAYVQSLSDRISKDSETSEAIRIIPEFVPDSKLPTFFGAADYSVFAHADSSLTSGALILSLSYGVPVIAEPMPAAELIQEEINGYVVKDDPALEELLGSLSVRSVPDPGVVQGSVADFTWERVAKETRAVYSV